MDRGGSGEDSPESSPGRRRGKGRGGRDGGGAKATGIGSSLSVPAASTSTTSGHGGRRTPTYTGDFTQQSPNIHTRQAVILWLQETYGVVPNSGLSTPKEDVYKDYAQMCARDGKSAMARATFGKILHVAFPGITCNRLGRRGSTKHSYRWLHRQIPLSDDDESSSPDGQRQTDSNDYPSAGHHSGGGGGGSSALDSYPGYSLGASMGLSRPAALSSQSPGSSSSLSPSFASPSVAGGGSAATIGASHSPPPSPIRLSTSLPPLPVYHPPFNPYPSAMHGGYPGSFAPSSSTSTYLMAASPPRAAPSSSLFHPSPLQHRRVPSPPPHSYPASYHQHLGSSYLSPTTALQEPARAPAPSGWSSHVDSLLYDTSGGSGVTGALDGGSAEQLSYRPNNSHHQQLQQLQQPHHSSLPPAVPTSTLPAGNLPRHYLSLTSPSSSGPTSSSSSLYPPLRPSPQALPPFHGAP